MFSQVSLLCCLHGQQPIWTATLFLQNFQLVIVVLSRCRRLMESIRYKSMPDDDNNDLISVTLGLALFTQGTDLTPFTAVCSSPALGSMPCCSPAHRWPTGGSTDRNLTALPVASTGACPISTRQRAPTLWHSSSSATFCPAASSSRLTPASW